MANFAMKSSGKDEWYTPDRAIYPILKYLRPNSIVWCPFDTEESGFVRILNQNGFKVINTHIKNGDDFFEINAPKCDYIVSNPPYSIRNKVLVKLFEINKPFMMLMNTNGLFDNRQRWNLFKDSKFSLIYLKGRVNYMEEYGVERKGSPPFQSAYVCNMIHSEKILFEEQFEK